MIYPKRRYLKDTDGQRTFFDRKIVEEAREMADSIRREERDRFLRIVEDTEDAGHRETDTDEELQAWLHGWRYRGEEVRRRIAEDRLMFHDAVMGVEKNPQEVECWSCHKTFTIELTRQEIERSNRRLYVGCSRCREPNIVTD